jgi:uncharacterized membrane protein
MDKKKAPKVKIGRKIRDQFIAGLLVLVPLAATVLILVWVFNSIDHILGPVIRAVFHRDIPGVGFGVTIILIYLAGVVATNVIGGAILRFFNRQLNKVPIFRLLYSVIRQIMEAFTSTNKTSFLKVVLVEFPRQGMWELGFVTNEIKNENGECILNVLIPTSPTPTSGFLQIVKEKDVIRTNISVEDGLKMVVSAGTMTPQEVKDNFPNL